MEKADIMVSVVAILRNQADILPSFVHDLHQVLDSHYSNFEILLVDNGSEDGTATNVKSLLSRYTSLRYLRLTRVAEDETALLAGLDAAIGDYVVTMHPDFDPPNEIVAMVEQCRSGADIVLGVDLHPPTGGFIYRSSRVVFLSLVRRLLHFDLVPGVTGFRVLSRHAVNAIVKVRLRRRYFAVVAADVGLNSTYHQYGRISRSGSSPELRLFRAVRMGLSVLVHNSITPLRLAGVLGLMGSLLSLFYSLYVVVIYLVRRDVMPGWTTLSLATSGLSFLVFLVLGLMAEYLGRLLEESSDRPLYHVRDEQSSEVMLSDLTRKNVFDHSEAREPST